MTDLFNRPWIWGSLIVVLLAYQALSKLIYSRLVRHTTILRNLDTLGRARTDGRFAGTAVVAGGSMAGLLAARVLSDHFETVTVVEPDNVESGSRSRVPQWLQAHIFLPISLLVYRRLWPNFDDRARAAGMLLGPAAYRFQMEGKTVLADESALPQCVTSTRASLEILIRELVCAAPNVKYVRGTVTGLVASEDKTRIRAALVQPADANGTAREIPAAFFADCTGPACSGRKWLARAESTWALSDAARDAYDPRVSYSTVIVPAPPALTEKFTLPRPWEEYGFIRQVYSSPRTGMSRGYTLTRGDNGCFIAGCSLWGAQGAEPRSWADVIASIEAIESANKDECAPPGVLAALRTFELTYQDGSQPIPCRVSDLYHLRYDKMAVLPDNFVACGDAAMRLNPTFGQGCSKAAMDATTLDAMLRAAPVSRASSVVPHGTGLKTMRRIAQLDRPLYDLTRWLDYQHPTTEPAKGETRATGGLLRTYFRAVLRLTHKDPAAGVLLWKTLSQVEPAALLFSPSFAAKVLLSEIKGA